MTLVGNSYVLFEWAEKPSGINGLVNIKIELCEIYIFIMI